MRAGTRLKVLAHGIDEPQGSVQRIEFGLFAVIRKAVRQHAVGHGRRPRNQDVTRCVEPPGGDAQAAQRDESVAPPVGKPWIARDDRLAWRPCSRSPYDVGVSRGVKPGIEFGTAILLTLAGSYQ